MVDFSVFFPSGTRRSEPLKGGGFLLHGPRSSGKTSFAFQAAVNTVLAGGSVVALCHEHGVYRKVPEPFTPLTSLDHEALHRLEFAYVTDWKGALRELMAMDDEVVANEAWRRRRGPADAEGATDEGARSSAPQLVLVDDDGFTMDEMWAAQCFSYLDSMYQRSLRCGRDSRLEGNQLPPFMYIVVCNAAELTGSELDGVPSLPISAFPCVHVRFSRSGMVSVTPLVEDTEADVGPLLLGWQGGLKVQTV